MPRRKTHHANGAGFFDVIKSIGKAVARPVLNAGLDYAGLGLKRHRRGTGIKGKHAAARSPWISHVKRYAAAHGCTYAHALSASRASYHKMGGSFSAY